MQLELSPPQLAISNNEVSHFVAGKLIHYLQRCKALYISSSTQALELELQKIDKDNHELARKLKTRRNTLAYISRLPTEIISKIFTTLAYSSLEHGSGLSWIRSVTAVCGHWRDRSRMSEFMV
jgi:hypothetical protein